MISALAIGAQVLDDAAYADRAARCAAFIQRHMFDAASGQLRRSYREGPSAVWGFVDDYAFLIRGLLDLYEATFDGSWLEWAATLQRTQDARFWDDSHGGYFDTTGEDASILLRMKDGP